MKSNSRPFVEDENRLIIFPQKISLPQDALFWDIEQAILDRIRVLAGLRNKTQKKVLGTRQNLVHAIVESLYLSVRCKPVEACVALQTSNHSHSRKSGKGFSSHRTVLLVIQAMVDLDWIRVTPGGRTRSHKNVVTTITAHGELRKRLEDQPEVWRPIFPDKNAEAIIVREKDHRGDKYSIDVVHNNEIKHRIKRVRQINSFFSQHAIALDLDSYELKTLVIRMAGHRSLIEWARCSADPQAHEQPLTTKFFDLRDTQICRIFSRGSTVKGGRHYGGFWQKIPKEFRNAITIDGRPTSEQDYAELHPRILYATAGLTPPAGDLYDIWLPQDPVKPDNPRYRQIRKLIKTLVNAWLNDEYGSFDLSSTEYAMIGMSRQQVRYRLLKKHPLLKRFKGCGKGLEFQYIDAEIAERVLVKLMAQDIVCLPIFDSFRVQVGYETELREAMISAYQEVLGGIPEICDPELPREPEIMPEYPTTFHDDQGRPYKMIDQTYVKNHLLTHPHAIYLQGYFMCHPPSETP